MYEASDIEVGFGNDRAAVRIGVVPGGWRWPRTFEFSVTDDGKVLHTDEDHRPHASDEIEELGESAWRITLRWSIEAPAAAACSMTFSYMQKVGEVIYAASVPTDWGAMTAAERGGTPRR